MFGVTRGCTSKGKERRGKKGKDGMYCLYYAEKEKEKREDEPRP
jgi:hypothetical protein